mgnify:FL=1
MRKSAPFAESSLRQATIKHSTFMARFFLFLLSAVLLGCSDKAPPPSPAPSPGVGVVVLGTAQDAGYPQANCQKACCAPAWADPSRAEMVSCLAIYDTAAGQAWLLDATPDFPRQLQYVTDSLQLALGGILLTHAHMGHYTGLMYLGREAMGADAVSVYAMPRMDTFLRKHGPWSQLVRLQNIDLRPLRDTVPVALTPRLTVTPLRVPHRDEYSETVGYSVQGPGRSLLFIPDIDKWDRWGRSIDTLIARHDLAFLDATFFDDTELPGRNMAEIPHPFVRESLQRFSRLSPKNRAKIHFIHLNHTNPLLQPDSPRSREVEQAGMHVARTFNRSEL